jgi:hypothetical protein
MDDSLAGDLSEFPFSVNCSAMVVSVFHREAQAAQPSPVGVLSHKYHVDMDNTLL